FGLDRIEHGRVLVYSRESTHASPAQRLAEGIGLLSENRKEEGLLLTRTLADNLTITRYGPVSRLGLVSGRRQRQCARDGMERLGVCDTIGVMCRGVLSVIRPAGEWNEHTLMAAAIGQSEATLNHNG